MGSFFLSFLGLLHFFSPLPHKKYKCAFMSPRNMTTSKCDNHKSGLHGISVLQNKKSNKDLDGISVLSFISGWYPGLVAAIWLLLPTESVGELYSQKPPSA